MDANFLTNAFAWLKDMGIRSADVQMIGERKFSPAVFKEIKPDAIPYPAQIEVFTLDALCNLIDKAVDKIKPEDWLLHVVDEERVDLIMKDYDTEYGRRRTLAQASPPETDAFEFGQYYDPDTFFIKIQSNFAPSVDLTYVQQIAANITSEIVKVAQDDGISQTVGVKQSIHLQGETKLKSRVTLAPFRTFIEVEQPASDFLFRAKQINKDALPQLALFEADGGKWRLEAIKNISEFLRNHATGVQVIS